MRRGFCWWLIVWTGLIAGCQPAAWGYFEVAPETSVRFELYRDYLIVVRGSIGPMRNLNLLLDTGASPSILDLRVARKLGLDIAPASVAVLNGNVHAGMSTVPSLQLGPVRRDNLSVLIQDLSFLEKAIPVQIDGIVGLDLLGQSAFIIDYGSREIRFGPAPSMPVSIPLQLKEGLPIVNATVDHSTVHLLLDTGASSLILFKEMPQPLAGVQGSSYPTSKTGNFERKQRWLNSFRLGEANFGHEPASIVPNHRDAGHDFDGLMSPAALGIVRVAVDLNRGTLAFARGQ